MTPDWVAARRAAETAVAPWADRPGPGGTIVLFDRDGVRGAPEQLFCDVKDTALGVPVVTYENDDDDRSFERFMRADYANCEHRTCVVDFTPMAVRAV